MIINQYIKQTEFICPLCNNTIWLSCLYENGEFIDILNTEDMINYKSYCPKCEKYIPNNDWILK